MSKVAAKRRTERVPTLFEQVRDGTVDPEQAQEMLVEALRMAEPHLHAATDIARALSRDQTDRKWTRRWEQLILLFNYSTLLRHGVEMRNARRLELGAS